MTLLKLPIDISAIVRFALEEDIGAGDITAELIPANKSISAKIVSRERGILCGKPWVDEVFQQLDESVELDWKTNDGEAVEDGQIIATLQGSARSILSGERCALNFLQTLSATATRSHYFAAMVSHTAVKLLDTRKTLPALRSAQKYAVRIGGCHNHRMGLYDAFLIKENHIAACGSIEAAIATAQELHPGKTVEIEVTNLQELERAIAASADIIMLDNFDLSDTAKAVSINDARSKLEASGGIDEARLVKIAETGVDYISIGALTKNCSALDLSLLVSELD